MKRAASITELYHLTPDTAFQLRGQSHIIVRQLTTDAITGEVFDEPRTFVERWSYSTLIAADPHEVGRWDYSTGPLISLRSAWGCFAC